MNDRELCLEVG